MKSAPLPPGEAERLAELFACQLLDTHPEQGFDDITRIAALACATPIALVSLVDQRRQWFKSRQGLDASETPRDVAFCAHAILGHDVFVVPDALADDRFRDNPLVTGPPHVRFYAGVPLVTAAGHALGTLCVIDHQPRILGAEAREILLGLGRQAVAQIELRNSASRLREQTAQIEDIVENASDLIQSVFPDGRLAYVNGAWRATLGYDEHAVEHLNLFDVIAPEALAHCRDLFARIMAGEPIREVEAVLLARDGRRVEVEGRVTVRRELGRPVATRAILRDVTARRSDERLLARFFDASVDLLCVAGTDGRFKKLNLAWERTLGWSMSELFASPFVEFVHPDDRAKALQEFARLLEGGSTVEFENRYRCKDGRYRHLLWTAVPNLDDGSVFGVAHDLTARLAAQAKLAESEGRLRAILDTTVDGIITIRSDGCIESFNAAAERIFGYAQAEVLGRNVSMLMPEPDRSRHDGYIASYLETREPKIIGIGREVEGLRSSGERFPMDLSISTVPIGSDLLFTGVVRDITARKELDRLKNEFVSTVSHELRTPLTSIRGSLRLLQAGAGGNLSGDAAELVGIATNNAERLIRLVNDILDLEKIEAGRMELSFEPVRTGALISRVLAELGGLAEQRGVSLRAFGDDLEVSGDEDRLIQVLTNLVANAIKFSPDGGEVGISASLRGPSVRIEVEDCGLGIRLEDRSRLFGKFTQLDASDDRRRGGTGLGLAIVKALVERHGGSVGVDSSLGSGSVFWFEVPCLARAPLPLAGASRPSVLLVEADPDLQRLLERRLEKDGYEAILARSVVEAREHLRGRRPDAAIIDMNMPEDGLELLRPGAGTPTLHGIPCIVLRADPGQGSFGGPMVFDCLESPLDEAALARSLRRALRAPGVARVLLVDDDRDTRRVIAAQLRHLGAEIHEARDGVEAVRTARQVLPDLIVLDIAMPGMDGFDVVEMLRGGRTSQTPLLVYTGRDLDETGRRALQLGVTRYLTKSLAAEGDFLAAVQELLDLTLPRAVPHE